MHTSVFVILFMLKKLQTGLTIILYVQKDIVICREVKEI